MNAFYWYYDGWGEPCLLREAPSADVLYAALEQCLAGAPRFWLVQRDTIAAARSRVYLNGRPPPGFHLVGGRHYVYVKVQLFTRRRAGPPRDGAEGRRR